MCMPASCLSPTAMHPTLWHASTSILPRVSGVFLFIPASGISTFHFSIFDPHFLTKYHAASWFRNKCPTFCGSRAVHTADRTHEQLSIPRRSKNPCICTLALLHTLPLSTAVVSCPSSFVSFLVRMVCLRACAGPYLRRQGTAGEVLRQHLRPPPHQETRQGSYCGRFRHYLREWYGTWSTPNVHGSVCLPNAFKRD